MNSAFPSHAQVVIVGGGIIGASVAWHLSQSGWSGIVLIDAGPLGSGTTWHSAGNIVRLDESSSVLELYRYGAELITEFNDETDIGWRGCGRVMVARSPERAAEFERLVHVASEAGVPARMIPVSKVGELLPFMNTRDLVAAVWSPGDGRVNPSDLLSAYISGAKRYGLQVLENTRAGDLVAKGNSVAGIDTDRGTIACDVVVNCTGLWARDLGLRHGVNVPLYPLEHFYILTETMAGVDARMPTFRDPDGLIYGREETGGLLVGCFDRDAKAISPSELPHPFTFSLLNEDWDKFSPYLQEGIHRIPALASTGVRKFVNGPEAFTPDGHPVMGHASELDGYFVLAGLNSTGVTASAGLGWALANWIVNGSAGIDLEHADIRRFTPEHNEEQWLLSRVPNTPSNHMRVKE